MPVGAVGLTELTVTINVIMLSHPSAFVNLMVYVPAPGMLAPLNVNGKLVVVQMAVSIVLYVLF